jgi:Domain of unknown function (DUF6378)
MKAPDIIRKAADLVAGDRNEQHGDIAEVHRNIAALWSAYLWAAGQGTLTPKQVAVMLVLLKIARTKGDRHNEDNYVDMAGYAGIAGQLAGPPEKVTIADIASDATIKWKVRMGEPIHLDVTTLKPLPRTRDEAGPVEAFERAWTGGELRREFGDRCQVRLRDLTTDQIVFELD